MEGNKREKEEESKEIRKGVKIQKKKIRKEKEEKH